MIQLSYPEPSKQFQTCYLSISEGTTGLHLLSGPHYIGPDGKFVHQYSQSFRVGHLYRDPDACSIGNEHPILHYNAKGSVHVQYDALTPPSCYMQLWPGIHEQYTTGVAIGMSDCEGSFGGYDSPSVTGYRVGALSFLRCNTIYGGYYPYSRECRKERFYGDLFVTSSLIELSPSSFLYEYLGKVDGKTVEHFTRRYDVDLSTPTMLADYAGYSVPCCWTQIDLLNNQVQVTDTAANIIATSPVITVSTESIEYLRRMVYSSAQRDVYSLSEPENVPWGTLVKDAVQSIRYIDSNSIENAAGFSDIKSNLPPIRAIKRLISKKDPRALAEIYLWYKYSLSPNISDSKEFLNAARRKSRRYTGSFYRSQAHVVQSQVGSKSVSTVCRANVKFAVSGHREAQMRLASWGFDPGIAQGWDLIPFSFVVDWFFHVGDTLSNFDWEFDNFVNSYQYESITYSTRATTLVNLPAPLIGSIEAIRYERVISRSIPFSYAIQSNSASSHILEEAALLVTNLGN